MRSVDTPFLGDRVSQRSYNKRMIDLQTGVNLGPGGTVLGPFLLCQEGCPWPVAQSRLFHWCRFHKILLEQLPKLTHEETETPGDFTKNTKLVRVSPPKGDLQWVSCHSPLDQSLSKHQVPLESYLWIKCPGHHFAETLYYSLPLKSLRVTGLRSLSFMHCPFLLLDPSHHKMLRTEPRPLSTPEDPCSSFPHHRAAPGPVLLCFLLRIVSHKMLPLADTPTVWGQVVLLDDFGSNLKPARDMGMVTILVRNTDSALRELEKVTGTQVTSGLGRVWLLVTPL